MQIYSIIKEDNRLITQHKLNISLTESSTNSPNKAVIVDNLFKNNEHLDIIHEVSYKWLINLNDIEIPQ